MLQMHRALWLFLRYKIFFTLTCAYVVKFILQKAPKCPVFIQHAEYKQITKTSQQQKVPLKKTLKVLLVYAQLLADVPNHLGRQGALARRHTHLFKLLAVASHPPFQRAYTHATGIGDL